MIIQPLIKKISRPLRLFLISGLAIFISELLVMLFLTYLPPLTPLYEAVVDAISLSFMISPILYFSLFKPMLNYMTQQKKIEEALIQSKAELEEQYKGLEIIIAERTAAIKEANKELSIRNLKLEQRNKEIDLLSQMNTLHQVCNTTKEAYDVIASFSLQLFQNDSGELLIITPSNNLLEAVASWGAMVSRGNTADKESSYHMLSADNCWALRRGQLHLTRKRTIDMRCKHVGPSSGSDICVPLIAQGEAIGVYHLMIVEAGEDSYGENLLNEKEQLAMSISKQISLALSNLKLREELHDMAIHDPLTGVFNRRYMEEYFRQEIYRAARKGRSIGVIMLDLDHFKTVNDTLGHEAGDIVLKEIGIFLSDNIRKSDIVCRIGGDEFVIIMPEEPLEVTIERAEQLNRDFKLFQRKGEEKKLLENVTLSFGVATFPTHGATPDEVLKAADQALYTAKDKGRDQVCVSEITAENVNYHRGTETQSKD